MMNYKPQFLLPLPKQKDTFGCLFCFVVKAEGLEPQNSKVQALLTVNSPVDCLRIELIIKPLPKKAPIFRCFFPLFMLFYGDFTCFLHIDKTTAHGFSVRHVLFDKLNISNLIYPWAKIFLALNKK